MRIIKNRKKYALKINDIDEIKQVNLENLWIAHIRLYYIDKYVASKWPNITESAIKTRMQSILAKIPVNDLQLPSVHDPLEKPKIYDFFALISNKCQNEIIASKYYKNDFIPENIIPFPKSYILFALDTLLNKESYKALIDDYNVTKVILLKKVININPELLPTDFEENRRVGNRFISSIE